MLERAPVQAAAVIIGVIPYAESDLILRMIVEGHGKVSMLAKNARKSASRFGSRLDMFDAGQAEATPGRGSLLLLKSFVPKDSFRQLRESLDKVTAASVLCECFDALVHEDINEDHHAYEYLHHALSQLCGLTSVRETLSVLLGALGKVLTQSGFADAAEFSPPGTRALERALLRVEEVSERPLRTRAHLAEILERYKRESSNPLS